MTIARSHLIDPSRSGAYHLIRRCVRRGFLCGDGVDHRRDWIRDAVRELAAIFAIDVHAYAIMHYHFHLVVAAHPERVAGWTAMEVVERWTRLFPLRDDRGEVIEPDPTRQAAIASDAAWVALRRERLASVSWFMKVMKERIARRANREDGCDGAFWQGRFTSVALLDQAAVTACMAYVDLNPIRARLAETPETSAHTSVLDRIAARQESRIAGALTKGDGLEPLHPTDHTETKLWITSMDRCTPWSDTAARACRNQMSTDDYLELVDQTGRIVKSGKRGAIPAHLLPILARLDLDAERWVDAVLGQGRFLGAAIGSAVARATEAVRRGCRWVADKARIYRSPVAN